MPAVDIADALGCSRKNITGIVKNNPHLFKGVSVTSTLQTDGGPQKGVCLSRDGVIGILMRVHPSGSKTEEGKTRIEKFQAWARDTLAREVQAVQVQQAQAPVLPVPAAEPQARKAWSDIASEHIRFAKTIARELNVPENMALAVAIQQAEKETGVNLSQYRKLIAPVQQAPAGIQAPAGPAGQQAPDPAGLVGPGPGTRPAPDYLTPSEIGRIIRLSAEDVNRYFERKGYQERDPTTREFKLTEQGSRYGRVFPYCAGSGHTGYFIKWDRLIIRDAKMLENRPNRIKE